MNRKIYLIFGLLVMALFQLGSCKYDTQISTPKEYERVYMPQATENPIVYHLKMADTAQTIIYGADYGGVDYPSTDIKVSFTVEPNLVDSFNEVHKTDYQMFPEGSYALGSKESVIPKGKTSTDPLALKIKTIGALQNGVKYLLPIKLETAQGLKLNEDLGVSYFLVDAKYDIINVSMPEAENIPVSYLLNMADTAQTIEYSAEATADIDLSTDIDLSFAAAPELIDSFNVANGSSYQKMPEGSFSIVNSKGKISKETGRSETYKLMIKTKDALVPFVKYLLPLRISTATGNFPVSSKIEISKNKGTTYFAIEATKNGIELTIVSYGKGSGYNDVESLASSIKAYKPDLLLIRELDLNTTRSGPVDQPKELAKLLDMPYYVFANALDYQGGEYGSAIFSKFPIDASATKTYMLSSSKSEKGPLVITRILVNGNLPLYFAGTHLNANASIRNDMQVPELMNIMKSYSGPMILAGDFNANPSDANDTYGVLSEQFTRPCQNCPPNFPASDPKSYSDYVLYKSAQEFSVLDYHVGQSAVGTHLPVILKVKWYVD